MNRLVQILNFVGVLALAALCAGQWRTNSQLNADVERLEKTRVEQAARLADQDKALKSADADLDETRDKLTKSDAALKDASTNLTAATAEKTHLLAVQEKDTAAIGQWSAAVQQRDQALQKVQQERNDYINRYNDLTNRYNSAVKELGDARAKLASAHP